LRQIGVHTGYNFKWSRNGPFCPVILDDIEEARPNLQELTTWVYDPKSEEKAKALKPLSSRCNARWLTVLASILFLSNDAFDIKDKDFPAHVLKKLEKSRYSYTIGEIKDGMKELKKYKLL